MRWCVCYDSLSGTGPFGGSCQIHGPLPMTQSESEDLTNVPDDTGSGGIKSPIINNPAYSHQHCPPEIHRSCFCVRFIAEHTKLLEDSTKVSDLSFKKKKQQKKPKKNSLYFSFSI